MHACDPRGTSSIISAMLIRPLLLTALLPARRMLFSRLLSRPRCSAAESQGAAIFPAWAIAPPELPEEWVACTVSHLEVEALHDLRTQAPKSDSAMLEELPPGLTIDLGMRRPSAVELTPTHVRLHFGDDAGPSACLAWSFLAKIAKKRKQGAWQCPSDCDDTPERIEGFSELTRRAASLMPIAGSPPTAILGGFGMHRFKGIDPGEDTARKLGALGTARGGLRGRVLDVCTGLGYTCLGAARTPFVEEVVTIELDPLMVSVQRANPWSSELFTNEKVTRLLGDATEILPALPDGYFGFVVHDPPANSMSGELYSLEFYSQLRRVLKDGGTLYHYVGDPSSKASGRLFKGIRERLREAGFADTKTVQQAYGIVAK